MIQQVHDKEEKKKITRQVLEALSDWFGIPEAREDYVKNSAEQLFFAAIEQDRTVGLRNLRFFPHYGMNGILVRFT